MLLAVRPAVPHLTHQDLPSQFVRYLDIPWPLHLSSTGSVNWNSALRSTTSQIPVVGAGQSSLTPFSCPQQVLQRSLKQDLCILATNSFMFTITFPHLATHPSKKKLWLFPIRVCPSAYTLNKYVGLLSFICTISLKLETSGPRVMLKS